MDKKDIKMMVFPEVVEASRPDSKGEAVSKWEVVEGSTARGEFATDLSKRVMRVPLVNDEVARVVRIHELTRSRISPKTEAEVRGMAWARGLSGRAIKAAEEFRVGAVVRNMGYDTDLLKDGTEKGLGERLAKVGNETAWQSAVELATALSGTKAFSPFVNGVKAHKPEWALRLRELQKQLKADIKWCTNYHLADSDPYQMEFSESGSSEVSTVMTTYGFASYTSRLAATVDKFLTDPVAKQKVSTRSLNGVEVPIGYGKCEYAPLVFDETVRPDQQVKGMLHRKKVKSYTGKRVLYPSRVITDPEKRVFGSKRRANGGVLVIDYSGSMSLTERDLDTLVDMAPSCLVIAYSQPGGSDYTRPNAWVLADRGKRVASFPKSMRSQGNGVDGSAIAYGISRRRSANETVIWVSDGEAIAGDGGWSDELGKITAELLYKNRVIWAPTVEAAQKVLANPGQYRPQRKVWGRVGRAWHDYINPNITVNAYWDR